MEDVYIREFKIINDKLYQEPFYFATQYGLFSPQDRMSLFLDTI